MLFKFSLCQRPLLTALLIALITGVARPADPRPNILLCIADDWGYPHAGAYGDRAIKTPAFDRLASQGALFLNAYCASPSCTPSRAALLSGRPIHQLQETGNLWCRLPADFVGYPDLLAKAGYVVGLQGKGWGPGDITGSGRGSNPAGRQHKSFAAFLATVPPGKPFCFWHGSANPHRPYAAGSGVKAGLKPADVTVPGYLPDTPQVRSDIADYGLEIQRADEELAQILKVLDETQRAASTLVIVTSDNGMPFPRAKANLYDAGTHMPLAVRWPDRMPAGQRVGALVSLVDLAPTILEAAGLAVPAAMTGRSLLALLTDGKDGAPRDEVFLERERHGNVRRGGLSYPARAVRTKRWLYIRNFRPERWPAGDPDAHFRQGPFGDIDPGPTKDLVLNLKNGSASERHFFRLACEKRPREELYDCQNDPWQVDNRAADPQAGKTLAQLRKSLDNWMRKTHDPRSAPGGGDDRWDRYEYTLDSPAQDKAHR